MTFIVRLGIAAAIVAGQALLIWLLWLFFKWLGKKLKSYGQTRFKPLMFRKYQILNTSQITSAVLLLLRILKYLITIFQLYITIPIVFSLFPLTKNLASVLFGYILTPLKSIGLGILKFIPNLFAIVIIVLITRYILRSLKFFEAQIQNGKLVIKGFYADWAQPTFNILKIFLYAFMAAAIYPLLPGSNSPVFQGISVFVGLIISLGSTSAIGNVIAGIVITYMRPFKAGDLIKLNEITGFVVEKSAIVTRIRTFKNEYVTFPNMMILTSDVVNYTTSSEENENGLIIHVSVTMGYDVPWPKIHEILIAAAEKTAHIEASPKPYVHQTALDDYYARYEINAYTKDVAVLISIYSDLYKNIQTGFNEAKIDMRSPVYQILMPFKG
ncbi:mechanosensitive ion channel family protein [Breznakiella homolactica]|uniref:Mechanosensitive ion channel n=2 Tax=Breznakiella homolactica TaxID=2798577 RepID=A0A7T7XRR9_9SPIR|nr:mechanosensitive ion channel family protein [Breznakiella homolactica]